MSSTSTYDARRLAHLPQTIQERIKRGQELVAQHYGADGKLKTPEQLEQERQDAEAEAKAKEEAAAAGGPDTSTEVVASAPPASGPAGTEAPSEDAGKTGSQGVTETPQGTVTTSGARGEDEPWEQRYKSLQGRFNHLAAEQQRRDEEMQVLREQVQRLSQQPDQGNKVDVTDASTSALSAEERASVGDDELLNFAARHAFQLVAPRLAKIEADIAALRDGIQPIARRVQHVQNETLFTRLDRDLPDWRVQNEDPKFIDWLEQVDPFSRIQRKMALKQAIDDNDAPRVVTVFNTYRAETGAKAQYRPASTMPERSPAQPTNGSGQSTGTGSGRVPLDTLVHPGRVRSAGTPAQTSTEEPPTVTRAELAQFRNDRARGVFRNDPEGLKKWSDHFDQAIAAGRVI